MNCLTPSEYTIALAKLIKSEINFVSNHGTMPRQATESLRLMLSILPKGQYGCYFIDDWPWADTASLDVLHYAAVRWADVNLPMLIVFTLRQEALSELPDVQSWLTKLKHATDTVPL